MQFIGSAIIRAPRDKVWDFVIDPAQVGQCGPGVESIEKIDDLHYRAVAKVGIGFVSARFRGTLEIVDEEAPQRAVLKASGQAPGSAADALTTMHLREGEEPGTTVMEWIAEVSISGTLASVGARLIEGTTNKLIGQTFDCIKAKLEA
jgi:carbon monoxide dehydrogenase subunit G